MSESQLRISAVALLDASHVVSRRSADLDVAGVAAGSKIVLVICSCVG